MNLKGTKTEQNLKTALLGESEARNKYNWYASRARKDGYEVIAQLFDRTAEQEKEHGKLWFKHLDGINDTAANLRAAANGEHYEWADMYKQFSKEAKEEGFDALATQFEQIAAIEKSHEEEYLKTLAELENGTLFAKNKPVTWTCLNCGHKTKSESAPDVCPACKHPKGYFKAEK